MKIAVVSDTHGFVERLESLKEVFDGCDKLFFLGDGETDIKLKRLCGRFTTQTVAVAGNNDFRGYYEKEIIEEVDGVKFLLTHGHRYGVRNGLDTLLAHAKEMGCAFALFGHTHESIIRECDGVILMNPGSLGYPHGARPSYGIIEGDKSGFYSKIVFI